MAAFLLVGCGTTSDEESAALSEDMDEPVGAFLRTAAVSAQDAHNYPAAVSYYRNLHDRDPEDPEAFLGLVRNLRYIGSAGEAVKLLQQRIVDHPDDASLRFELGKAQIAISQPALAVVTLTQVRGAMPESWEVRSALGIAYDMLGNFDEAQESYRAALDLSPGNLSVVNNLALSLALSGEIDEGLELLVVASRRPSTSAHVRQNLALLYAMKGDVESAERLAERDLPPEMVRNNVAYYERLAMATAGGMGLQAPISPKSLPQSPPAEGTALPPSNVVAQPTPDEAAPVEPAETVEITPVEPAEVEAPPEEEAAVAAVETGYKVELGEFDSYEGATEWLVALRDRNIDLLSGLAFEISHDVAGEGTFTVVAGPLVSEAMAADLCTKLHTREEPCKLVAP